MRCRKKKIRLHLEDSGIAVGNTNRPVLHMADGNNNDDAQSASGSSNPEFTEAQGSTEAQGDSDHPDPSDNPGPSEGAGESVNGDTSNPNPSEGAAVVETTEEQIAELESQKAVIQEDMDCTLMEADEMGLFSTPAE